MQSKKIEEKDLVDKMIELLRLGIEYTDRIQCVFFTWNEFFNDEDDLEKAEAMARKIWKNVYTNEEDSGEEFLLECLAMLD